MIINGKFEKYSRLTFSFNTIIDYIKIIKPNNEEEKVESFIYQPIKVSYDAEGIEKVEKNGEVLYECRYTPDFSGSAKLQVYYNSKIIEDSEIEITDSEKHGYIEISKSDGKYFSFTDGSPFFAIGINTAFPTGYGMSDGTEFGLTVSSKYLGLRQYERWFKKLSLNGCNVARVWLGHEYFSPDTEIAGQFDYSQFSKIDMLFDLAKKYNIKLKITIEQFGFFDYEKTANSNSYSDDVFRKFNKRLYHNNEPCKNMDEWIRNEKWSDLWLLKMSEFAKRYSGDTELFAIELWNEMDTLYVTNKSYIFDWNNKILPIVKGMFPKNFVVNSLGSLGSSFANKLYNNFCWDKSSFVQIHRYIDQGAQYTDCHKSPIDMLKGAFERVISDKPILIAETGAVNNCHSGPFKFYVNDDDGIIFADTVYTPVFCKSCGTGCIWHWDERYVESKNLYHLFRPISDLISGIEIDRENFEPVSIANENIVVLMLKSEKMTLGYIRNANYNWENVLRDLSQVPPVAMFRFNIANIKNVTLYPVWENDNTSISFDDNTVTFENIGIGTLFKIETNCFS